MPFTPRAALRDAIFRSGRSQFDVADRAGIHESRLSKIVRGRLDPNDQEKRALARVLKTEADDLFPSVESVAS